MLLYTTIDRWYLNHNSAEIVDLYYNPDSNAGGQYVENHISYDLIKESYINSEGDTDVFFDLLDSQCLQYCIDKGTDIYDWFDDIMRHSDNGTSEDITYVKSNSDDDAYYLKKSVLFDRDEEVMNKLVVIATAPTVDNPCGIPSNAMTEEEYLGFKGCSSPVSGYVLDKLRCNRQLKSERGKRKFEKECKIAADKYRIIRENEKQNYDFLISVGILRDKTLTEKSLCKAHGHPDNESTQAARRVLDKRGIDWKTGKKKSAKYIIVCSMNREIYLIPNAETKTDFFDSLEDARKAMLDDVVSTYTSITEKNTTIDELMELLADTHYDSPVEGTIDTNHNYAWMNFDLSNYDAYDIKILKIEGD